MCEIVNGTPKQIAWAEKIREQAIEALRQAKFDYSCYDFDADAKALFDQYFDTALVEMENETDARKWINWETKPIPSDLYSRRALIAYKFLWEVGFLVDTEDEMFAKF